MISYIKILADHAQWLKDCQRDAGVQDAIAWAVERLRQTLCNNTTDVQELIADLRERQDRINRIAANYGATPEGMFEKAASALQAQADALNRKTCEALNTQRAQEERIAELEAKLAEVCNLLDPNMIFLEGDPKFFAYNTAASAVERKTYQRQEWVDIKNDIAKNTDWDNI